MLRRYQTVSFAISDQGSGRPAAFQPAVAIGRVLRIAVRLFSAPLAVAEFTDARLRWARSYVGAAESWTEREFAVCRHVLSSDETLVLDDLRSDTQFSGQPLKIAGVDARSCATTPIQGPAGEKIGVLCLFDHRPNRWTPGQLAPLHELAGLLGQILCWIASDSGPAGASGWLATEHRLQALFENTTDLIYTQNLRGEITAVNRAAEHLLGYSREELMSMDVTSLVAEEQQETAQQMILNQFGGGVPQTCELSFRTKGGRFLALEVSTHLLFEKGQPVGLMAFGRHTLGHERQRENDKRLETRFGEVASDLAQTGRCLKALRRLSRTDFPTAANLFAAYLRTGCQLFGLSIGMLVEIEEDCAVVLASCGDAAIAAGDRLPLTGSRFRRTATIRKTFQYSTRRPRVQRPVYCDRAAGLFAGAPIFTGGNTRRILAFASRQPRKRLDAPSCAILELLAEALSRTLAESDMRAHIGAQEHLTGQAEPTPDYDSLTGLPTTRQAARWVSQCVEGARSAGEHLALALFDLDRFKHFNNALGLTATDLLLRRIAERLQRTARSGEFVAHMGSDRFLVAFARIDGVTEAAARVSEILDTLRRPFPLNDLELFITASAGLSSFPADGEDFSSLLWSADAALGEAKRTGRDNLKIYTAADRSSILWLLELESALHKALEHNELEIRFQPILTVDGSVYGLEALLAWRHPVRGIVPAEQFIRIAEDTGIIVPIGAWALEEASRIAASWQRIASTSVRLAVNVSALQFARDGFVEIVAEALRKTGLPPDCLELEVTESVVMRDFPPAVKAMTGLRSLGIRISIDDFGTGYSSLAYLQRLPADALKIDRSFLQPADSPQSDRPLFRAIVALARSLGLATVAEGVETEEQFELARQAGCDRVQGHLFGHRMSAAAVRRLLVRRRPS